MNEDHDLKLSEGEAELIRAARANPQIGELMRQLAAISRDADPGCRTADDAEERIHSLGESLKLSSLTGWAQSASDAEAARFARLGGKRSKKKP